VTGVFENGRELSGSIGDGEFIDQLSDNQILHNWISNSFRFILNPCLANLLTLKFEHYSMAHSEVSDIGDDFQI
jgi:hypothetical protein